MNIFNMTKEDFAKVPPYDGTNFDFGYFRSIVIIPTNKLHDSGYMNMEYCLANDDSEPLVRVAGGSDVLVLDGVGECKDYYNKGWMIDCLPCGYLRLFSRYKMHFKEEWFYSAVEVYATKEDAK